jgi:hypothetical protein
MTRFDDSVLPTVAPTAIGGGRGQLHIPSIVNVRFEYAFSSKRYPTAQTPLGPRRGGARDERV